MLAYADLTEAGASLKRLQELDEFDEPLARRSADFVAHTVCLVVSYARSFSDNEGTAEVAKRLPERLLSDLDETEQRMHNRIVELRNTEFAHSDARRAGMNVKILDINGLRMGMPISRVLRHPFSRQDVPIIERLFIKVGSRIGELLEELPQELPVDEVVRWE